MTSAPRDPESALDTLMKQGPKLDLSSLDLCFAAALYLRGRSVGLAALDEERLVGVFEETCESLAPETENPRVRATHAIRRLREQRILSRVDGAGVVRAGEFALSRLGAAIVEFYLEEDVLTRQNLTLLTGALLSSLGEVRQAAASARSDADWERTVVGPLRVTVADLADGIERRQRGLDHQQETFQREISRVLETDWFKAVDRCQTLLESTAETLRELGDVLLRDTQQLQLVLQEILMLAMDAEQAQAASVSQRLIDQVDRIVAWGSARQAAWSEYYGYVHRYLRDVVRIDPSRALARRLREHLRGHALHPYALVVTRGEPLTVLRELKPAGAGKPVRRKRKERDAEPEAGEPDQALAELEARVQEHLDQGETDLSRLTERLIEGVSGEERFLLAGRVAQVVARLGVPTAAVERPWMPAGSELFVEEWNLESGDPSE